MDRFGAPLSPLKWKSASRRWPGGSLAWAESVSHFSASSDCALRHGPARKQRPISAWARRRSRMGQGATRSRVPIWCRRAPPRPRRRPGCRRPEHAPYRALPFWSYARTFGSSSGPGATPELRQLRDEALLVVHATHVEDQGSILDVADDRDRQLAERRGKRVQMAAARSLRLLDRWRGLSYELLQRQSAGADLARAVCDADHASLSPTAAATASCKRAPMAAISSFGRAK